MEEMVDIPNTDAMLSDTDDNQPISSPPRRRRRSTFFVRRDSIAPPPGINDEIIEKQREDDEEHLRRYYEKLYIEKEEWKKETNNRKNKYHDLRQQYQLIAAAPTSSRISYSVLTNEDIEFLKNKINMSKLIESQTKLHKSTQEVIAFTKRLNELDQVAMEHIQQVNNRITEHILENSSLN